MTEGRKSQIVLLDERRLDIIIQPKLHSYELLDLVASHFKLREKQYFGLGFLDETNHFAWLQTDKRVLDHEFPKKNGLLILYFSIRFYVETIGLLRDSQTVELFYLNARQVLFKGPVECDTETVFELAAHVLQATNGDHVSEEETREELKKLPLIPTCTLREHPSITYCEDRVISNYEKITGTSRGLAIVNYMTIIENLPTYGIHFYEVKDKKDIPWWLGISPKGIAVYDKDDKKTPRKLFTWKNLENLYYRDRKFSIEVSGPKRIVHTLSSLNPYEDALREPEDSYDALSSAITDPTTNVSVSRRTFGSGSNVDVHAWFAATSQLTKGIWSMAVNQHQFYLDRKQSKSQLLTARSMSEIAADLCRSTTSLPGSLGSDLSRSPSSQSLPSLSNSRYDLTIEQSDSLKAEREMVKALKARKEALEEALAKKTEELKRLCYEEGELTGVLPHDTPPLVPGEQVPTFRRRVGTAFSLSVKNKDGDSKGDDSQLSSELSKLELEVELQGKITSAALRLASDKTVSKYVRKQRRQSYTKAIGKLKDMEKKLGDMRRQMGKPVSDHHHHHHSQHHHHHRGQKDDLHRSGGFSSICQASVIPGDPYEDQKHRKALSPSHSSPQLSYGPSGHLNQPGGHMDDDDSPSSTPTYSNLDALDGVTTASCASSSTGVGGGKDPSFTPHHHLQHHHQPFRLDGSQDSGFSSANNMYHVNSTPSSSSTRVPSSSSSSHLNSSKDQLLRSPASSEPGVMSPLQHQYGHEDYDRRAERMMYSPDRGGHNSGGESERHIAAAVGENQYSNVSGNIKPSSSNSSIHYGSLDRQQIRNYSSKGMVYRDMSPMRYTREHHGSSSSVGSGGSRDRHHYQGGDSSSSIAHHSNVILEVPIHHDSLHSSPIAPHRSSSRPDLNQLRNAGGVVGDSSSSCGSSDVAYNASNCYSPRYQEGSGLYKDVDATHVHRAPPMTDDGSAYSSNTNQTANLAGHHTASQPTFHRIERSMSPVRPQYRHPPQSSSPSYQQQQHHQHISPSPSTSSSLSAGGGVIEKIPQSEFYQQKQTSSSSLASSPSSSSYPRTIPIQHIESSSRTPPPSSPTSFYSPQNSSQSSPRAPSTPTSHASSALVTTPNLQQPHMEVTKPYEISDFYRYSEKLRRQRIIDQYQRQLIGNVEKISRSSTPQSVEGSEGGHSSHSSSSSHYHPHHNMMPTQQSSAYLPHQPNPPHNFPQSNYSNTSNLPPTSRGPPVQYGRSSSAPLSSLPGQQQQHPYHLHLRQQQHYDPITTSSSSSSSSSYCIKSQGPGSGSSSTSTTSHYAYQTSSTYSRVQQIHSVYQSPQPMTCKPVKAPPKHDHNN